MNENALLGALAAALLALLVPAAGLAAIPARDGAATYPDDSVITSQVMARLAADEQLRAMTIRVRSHDGIVQLNGVVDSEERAERAAEIAHQVAGVWRVQNVLAVRPPVPCAADAADD